MAGYRVGATVIVVLLACRATSAQLAAWLLDGHGRPVTWKVPGAV